MISVSSRTSSIPVIVGRENLNPATGAWGLQMALAYVDHLAARAAAAPAWLPAAAA